jgi:hypothetical protein
MITLPADFLFGSIILSGAPLSRDGFVAGSLETFVESWRSCFAGC